MRRQGVQLSLEVLVEEARFILSTLLRDDLFGDRVRLTEAERVIDSAISLSFADYCAFLNKYGYVRVDQLANVIEVTEGGAGVAASPHDVEFEARLGRHFARELGTSPVLRPLKEQPVSAPPAAAPEPTSVRRPSTSVSTIEHSTGGDEVLDRRYRKGAFLGAGPIGSVFSAEHIGLGRAVAVKEARAVFQFVSYLRRDEIVRRLKSTVQAHAALLHPGIIQILDQNAEREHPYFVMELASGGSLRSRMKASEDGKIALPVAIRALLQMCYALRYAHSQGVLHLGLKPENVLFDHFGNVKLSDFGFARVADREEESSQVPVLVGSGTVGYLSPERIQPGSSPAPLGPAADIYAMGIIVYEMLTGKLPGRRSPLPSQARKEVPSAFDDVFDKMTRDDLKERYATIDDVLGGIYKAFQSKDVYSEGTILLWAADPAPLPKPRAQDPNGSGEDGEGIEVPDEALVEVSSEARTGEVDVSDYQGQSPPTGTGTPAPNGGSRTTRAKPPTA